MAAFHSAEQVAEASYRWTAASVLGFAVTAKRSQVIANDAPVPITREDG